MTGHPNADVDGRQQEIALVGIALSKEDHQKKKAEYEAKNANKRCAIASGRGVLPLGILNKGANNDLETSIN